MKCIFFTRCGAFLPGETYEVGHQQALALIADGAAAEVKDAAAEPEIQVTEPKAQSYPWRHPEPDTDLLD